MLKTRDKLEIEAKLFRGLADTSRLAILEALRRGPRTVSEVVALTGLSQPNASTHLNCLWCCGLVQREVRGRFTYYWIRSRRVSRMLQAAHQVLDDVSEHIAECGRYGEEKP